MMTPGRKIALGLAVGSLMLILNAGSAAAQDRGRGDVQYVNHDSDRHDDHPAYRNGGYYRPGYCRPVYYRPAPVYYTAAPVYYAPAPVYYAPAPVYCEPAPRPVVSIDLGLGFWFGGHRH
jgi:hypothetical protein